MKSTLLLCVLFCSLSFSLCDESFRFNGYRLDLSNSGAEFRYKNDDNSNEKKFDTRLKLDGISELDSTGDVVKEGDIQGGSWSNPRQTTLYGVLVNESVW
jgi:hypothetical protein